MEGDAGASRLTPNDTDDSSSSEVRAEDSASEVRAEDSASEVKAEDSASEVKAEDSAESEDGTDQPNTAEDGTDQPNTAEDGTDQKTSEVEAEDSASQVETDQTNTAEVGTDDEITESDAEESTESEAAEAYDDMGIQSRLGRGWFIGIAAALLVLAGGVGAGGYLTLRSHLDSEALARRDAVAMEAAKNCVAATQAPDTTAMAESAQKMIDCGTGAYRSQAILYSSLLVEAYQAANAHVQVSDLRAAVERNNPDGSVDVLVPLRVRVSNSESQNQEAGYRLRVTMVSDEGQYRIAKLDQVAK
jgi:Mce-associated membrane protein